MNANIPKFSDLVAYSPQVGKLMMQQLTPSVGSMLAAVKELTKSTSRVVAIAGQLTPSMSSLECLQVSIKQPRLNPDLSRKVEAMLKERNNH